MGMNGWIGVDLDAGRYITERELIDAIHALGIDAQMDTPDITLADQIAAKAEELRGRQPVPVAA